MMIKNNTLLKRKILALVIIAGLSMGVSIANADDIKWILYKSDTGIFDVRAANKFDTKTSSFRIDDERIANSSTAISVVDQRRFKDTFKSYLIKIDQTIGPALTYDQIETFLNYEIQNYTNRYIDMNAVIKNKELKYFNGKPGAELQISYEDPDMGARSTRVRILYTDATRVEQSLTGDEHILYGYQAKKFFKTLLIRDGLSYTEGKLGGDWGTHTSPMGLFTVFLPHPAPPYVMKEPRIKAASKNSELISQTFYDPVWGHKIFYRVHGYKFNQELSMANVKKVLFDKHVSKYKRDSSTFQFTKTPTENHMILETEMNINPPSKALHANFARLRVFFAKNYMVVQEIISTKPLATSTLIDKTMNLIEFHPDKVNEVSQKSQNPSESQTKPQEEELEEPEGKVEATVN
ncbi:MAG: hypothetical protein DHS20C02_00810 [Micavibrio sp.]|nr:MAG: hypothetical protein DHS20C02_00810 [Micavibrio sp.]